jgi:hypothetical protein
LQSGLDVALDFANVSMDLNDSLGERIDLLGRAIGRNPFRFALESLPHLFQTVEFAPQSISDAGRIDLFGSSMVRRSAPRAPARRHISGLDHPFVAIAEPCQSRVIPSPLLRLPLPRQLRIRPDLLRNLPIVDRRTYSVGSSGFSPITKRSRFG